MDTFFQVLSNLKMGGDFHAAGDIFQGEAGSCGDLVELGVLKVVEGATDMQSAKDIVASQQQVAAEAQAEEEIAAPKNTWEASKPAEQQQDAAASTDTTPAQVGTGDQPPPADAGAQL